MDAGLDQAAPSAFHRVERQDVAGAPRLFTHNAWVDSLCCFVEQGSSSRGGSMGQHTHRHGHGGDGGRVAEEEEDEGTCAYVYVHASMHMHVCVVSTSKRACRKLGRQAPPIRYAYQLD
jgi:hypothetical protein